MCNLYSITTNQAAIIGLFRVINRYVGNLAPMPGVFPDYAALVIRNTNAGTEMVPMRPACRHRPALAGLAQLEHNAAPPHAVIQTRVGSSCKVSGRIVSPFST
jgi:hypothetical protein